MSKQRGEGSGKRAVPEGDEGSIICQKRQCMECGGASVCQHNRERSKCKECGGEGICQPNRRRSKGQMYRADKDDSLPPGFEDL